VLEFHLQVWSEVHHAGRFDRLGVLGFAIDNCLIDYKAAALDILAAQSKQFFGAETELYQQTDGEMIHAGHLIQKQVAFFQGVSQVAGSFPRFRPQFSGGIALDEFTIHGHIENRAEEKPKPRQKGSA
jgi:hypothetical protein